MAFILKDRVKETTTTTGTSAYSLGGSSATFDAFQTYMSNGDTTYYSVAHTTVGTDEWEVGIGTWNTGNTLSRTTVLAGSNGTSAVNFGSGSKEIFMTYPADKALFKDASGNLTVGGNIAAGSNNLTATGTVALGATSASSLTLTTDLAVTHGGTGVSSFTGDAVLISNAGGTALSFITSSDEGAILQFNSSNVPVASTIVDCGTY